MKQNDLRTMNDDRLIFVANLDNVDDVGIVVIVVPYLLWRMYET